MIKTSRFFLSLVILALLFSVPAFAQDVKEITGDWYGSLKIPSMELSIVFHFVKDDKGNYTSTMDSPDQSAFGIKVDSVSLTYPDLILKIKVIKGSYTGKISAKGEIVGTWQQGGLKAPLNLSKKKPAAKARPQMPKKPYPYKVVEVTFKNLKAGHTLAGTLTIPESTGPFPAVVLISGSGPQDRDESLMGHKPFLILADHLTRKGIAVLRYDDRGTADSKGNFATATSEDFADDAEAAMKFLQTRPEIDKSKIGFAGHSEGGLIAPMIAARNMEVAFIVLLAGPGLTGKEILLLQSTLISKAMGVPANIIALNGKINSAVFDLIIAEPDNDKVKEKISIALEDLIADQPEFIQKRMKQALSGAQLEQIISPWFRFFLEYDPAPTLKKVKCPVLAINGEKDLQVPPQENLAAIALALKEGGNDNYQYKMLMNLNHLFQNCETGAPAEYGKIEETFADEALNVISDWILKTIK